MAGRYGVDLLNRVLLFSSVIIALLAQLAQQPWISAAAYVFLAAAVYRMLSKNLSRRSMENSTFSMLLKPFFAQYYKIKNRLKDIKTHKYMRCPGCKAELRLPRGKGKISVTCPRCKASFIGKT